jgi:feruloyl esterase
VPEHCRITGVIAPEVRFEVNLPAAWNRRFYMHGNGGFAGETPETGARPRYRAAALRNGFVTASTNTGHDAATEPVASFATSAQKRIDYAFRAVHLTATEGKRIAAAYYGRPPAYAYWDGCSTGGRQGLISAQRFPADFDGIVAGAPVLAFVNTVTQSLWNGLVLTDTPVPIEKMKLVAEAVYARCDAKDGLKDGLIDDPRNCDFDPARHVAQCAAGQDAPTCLTAGQSAAIKKIYSGVTSNGKPAHFGYPVGAEVTGASFTGSGAPENGWDQWLIVKPGEKSRQQPLWRELRQVLRLLEGRPELRCADFRFRQGPAALERGAAPARCNRSGSVSLPLARRQAADVFRLGRYGSATLMGIDYYEKALDQEWRRHARLFPLVHGAGDVSLPRRRRHGPLRSADSAHQLGGERRGAAYACGVARRARQGGAYAAAVPLSTGCAPFRVG